MAFAWSNPLSLRGGDGKQGVGFGLTSGKPTDQGAPNESRLDRATFTIWSYVGNDWTQSASFAGAVGAVGPADYVGFGDTDPDSTTYSGDSAGIYFQRVTGAIWLYTKQGGWKDSGSNTRGPKGDAGVRGSYRYVADGPPPSDTSGLTPQPLKGDEWLDKGTPGGPFVSYFQ